jgi:hypothetical protein
MQAWQDVLPLAPYVPGGQVESQVAEPATLKEPGVQGRQAEMLVCCSRALAKPPRQSVHMAVAAPEA